MGCLPGLWYCWLQLLFQKLGKWPAVIELQQVKTWCRAQSTEPPSEAAAAAAQRAAQLFLQSLKKHSSRSETRTGKPVVIYDVMKELLLWSTTSLTLMSPTDTANERWSPVYGSECIIDPYCTNLDTALLLALYNRQYEYEADKMNGSWDVRHIRQTERDLWNYYWIR